MGGQDFGFQNLITRIFTAVSQTGDLSSPNSSTEIIQVTGTWVGTIVIEGSNDDVTYYVVKTLDRSTNLLVSSITANGSFESATNGFQFLRARSSAWTSGTATLAVYGSDASSLNNTIDLIRGGTDGTIVGNNTNRLLVDGSTVTQPISAASLPLPTGAATSALQTTGNSSLSSIDTKLTTTNSSLSSIDAGIPTALGQTTMTASMPVVIASNQSTIPVSFTPSTTTDLLGTDSITSLNDSVTANTQGRGTVAFTVTGTWVATLTVQGTVDGTNWVTLDAVARPTNTLVTTLSANNTILIECAGFQSVRLTATAFTSGTATVAYDASVQINDDDPTYGNNGQAIPVQSQLVSGSDGTNMIPLAVDSSGRLVTTALTGFGADFAFGQVTTAALTRVLVNKTTYTAPTTNAQRSISSANANDTAAGTGARTVLLTYFDQTGAGPFTETITLNGTTAVNTVATNICFIEEIKVVTVGSTGSNVGIITLFAATAGGGGTVGTIAATDNQTLWAHHYVATGKVCSITGVSCGHNGTTVGSGALFTLNSRILNVTNTAEIQISDFVRLYGQTSTFSRVYQSPIKVTGPAFIRIFCTPETSSSTIYRAAFDFFET